MVYTTYTTFDGILQVANVFLAIVAGFIAISLFNTPHEDKHLKPWRPLIIALVLFAVEEILGALRSFNIYSTPHLTHIVPSFIMAFLIWALVLQIKVAKETK